VEAQLSALVRRNQTAPYSMKLNARPLRQLGNYCGTHRHRGGGRGTMTSQGPLQCRFSSWDDRHWFDQTHVPPVTKGKRTLRRHFCIPHSAVFDYEGLI
jgi:hypothetical protein